MNQGGKRTLAYVDLADPGGISTISRSMSPRSTASRCSMSSRWCLAGINPTSKYSMNAASERVACLLASSSAAAFAGDNACELVIAVFNGMAHIHCCVQVNRYQPRIELVELGAVALGPSGHRLGSAESVEHIDDVLFGLLAELIDRANRTPWTGAGKICGLRTTASHQRALGS